jgi:hypothetical protein
MTDITKFDDLIDIRDVISRIEDLESERKPIVAGFNMPGYMPDSEPCRFSDFDEAREYLADMLETFADECDSEEPEDIAEAELMRNGAVEIRKGDGELGVTIGNHHYWATHDESGQFEDAEDRDEYASLLALLEACKGYGGDEQYNGDWYPVILIRDSYFVTYAQELADDIGAIPDGAQWPNTCIDWEQAARELRMDYAAIDFDGVTYWTR